MAKAEQNQIEQTQVEGAEAATEEAAPAGETKRGAFERLAAKRMGNALTAIKSMETLGNKNNYDFTPKHVEVMKAALLKQVDELVLAMSGDVAAKAGFAFGDIPQEATPAQAAEEPAKTE